MSLFACSKLVHLLINLFTEPTASSTVSSSRFISIVTFAIDSLFVYYPPVGYSRSTPHMTLNCFGGHMPRPSTPVIRRWLGFLHTTHPLAFVHEAERHLVLCGIREINNIKRLQTAMNVEFLCCFCKAISY